MDSSVFFSSKGNIWKHKAGIYCLEQEALSKKFGKRIFKVGYARNNIYTRMSDYRSAYGGIPFKIYCLLHIPAGVFGKRPGYTLLNEQRLHKRLRKDNRSAGQNEWYFYLDHIMDVMYSLYIELVGTIERAKKWEAFFYDSDRLFNIGNVVDEKTIKSKTYDGLAYQPYIIQEGRGLISQSIYTIVSAYSTETAIAQMTKGKSCMVEVAGSILSNAILRRKKNKFANSTAGDWAQVKIYEETICRLKSRS
jgi:hypothetical protein